ncbi:MAG TPA: ankyrin repeat domain-containing protein [Bdellovibrionota bacterium]|nr:ankyrin repeat domain-containing protein [Bdellovibrionota bacterium]
MKGTVKLHTLHADGRKEKLALNVSTGDKVPLNRRTIGFETGCHLDVKGDQVRIVADPEAPDFTFRNESGRDFDIKPGNMWEGDNGILEFITLPQPEIKSEDATRYVSLSSIQAENANAQAAVPKPTEQGPSIIRDTKDTENATSVILRMSVPERVVDAPPPNPGREKLEIKGSPPPPTDVDLRRAQLVEGLISFFILALATEFAARVAYLTSSGQLHIPFGASTPFILLLVAATTFVLHTKQADKRWSGTKLQLFRRLTWGSAGICLFAAVSSGISVSLWNLSTSGQREEVAQSPEPPATTAQSAPQDANNVAPQTSPELEALSAQLKNLSKPLGAKPDLHLENPSLAKEEFFSAVRSGDLGVVRTLVNSRSVDVNITLDRGVSALHLACAKGNHAMVKYLISKRANINARDPGGTTPLMWATYNRHKDIVEYLVKRGADLNLRREDGYRAIDLAKRYGLKSYIALLTPKPASRAIASEKKAKKSKNDSSIRRGIKR